MTDRTSKTLLATYTPRVRVQGPNWDLDAGKFATCLWMALEDFRKAATNDSLLDAQALTLLLEGELATTTGVARTAVTTIVFGMQHWLPLAQLDEEPDWRNSIQHLIGDVTGTHWSEAPRTSKIITAIGNALQQLLRLHEIVG